MSIAKYTYTIEHGIDGTSKIKAGLYLYRHYSGYSLVKSQQVLEKIKASIEQYGTEYEKFLYHIFKAKILLESSKIQEALETVQNARKELTTVVSDNNYDYHKLLSSIYSSLGDLTLALHHGELALTISNKEENPLHIGIALAGLSHIHTQSGKAEQGRMLAKSSKEILSTVEAPVELAQAYGALGYAENNLGNPKTALNYFLDAITILKSNKKRQSISTIGNMLNNCSGVYYMLSDLSAALQSSMEAATLFKKSNNKLEYISALYNIGALLLETGNIAESLEYLYDSKQMAEESGIVRLQTASTMTLGVAHMEFGDSIQGKKHLESALELANKYKFVHIECYIYMNLSKVYERLGIEVDAESYCLKALEHAEALRNEFLIAMSRQNYAVFLEKKNKTDSAIVHFYLAYDKVRELKNNQLSSLILSKISHCFLSIGQQQKALECSTEAMTLANKGYNNKSKIAAFEAMATVHEALGELEKAAHYYKLIVKLSDEMKVKNTIADIIRVNNTMAKKSSHLVISAMEEEIKKLRKENETLKNSLKNQTLKMIQNRELISEIQTLSQQQMKSPSETVSKISEILQTADTAESVWNALYKEIERTDPDILNILLLNYPTLTKTELKICILLSMKLSSKSIASLLFIEKITIDKHRQNIRKKMKLKPNIDLVIYLLSLRKS